MSDCSPHLVKLFNVLNVSPGLESTDSKQTSSGGAASSQQFDANRDIQIMNIEDKNTAPGNKDDDNDEDDDEVSNDNDATGVVETDNDDNDIAISEDKPIFDGNTPSLADGAGKVPESKYPGSFSAENL